MSTTLRSLGLAGQSGRIAVRVPSTDNDLLVKDLPPSLQGPASATLNAMGLSSGRLVDDAMDVDISAPALAPTPDPAPAPAPAPTPTLTPSATSDLVRDSTPIPSSKPVVACSEESIVDVQTQTLIDPETLATAIRARIDFILSNNFDSVSRPAIITIIK